jgi:hypothetical protein
MAYKQLMNKIFYGHVRDYEIKVSNDMIKDLEVLYEDQLILRMNTVLKQ